MPDETDDSDNWGGSIGTEPLTTTRLEAYKFFKSFQLDVLMLLCLFVIILLAFDTQTAKAYTKEILPYVLPLFTFVLGMGVRARDDER